jgi:hypothetical protein
MGLEHLAIEGDKPGLIKTIKEVLKVTTLLKMPIEAYAILELIKTGYIKMKKTLYEVDDRAQRERKQAAERSIREARHFMDQGYDLDGKGLASFMPTQYEMPNVTSEIRRGPSGEIFEDGSYQDTVESISRIGQIDHPDQALAKMLNIIDKNPAGRRRVVVITRQLNPEELKRIIQADLNFQHPNLPLAA